MTSGEAAALVAKMIDAIRAVDAADEKSEGECTEVMRLAGIARGLTHDLVVAMTSQWRPIQTAPRGERVLVYSTESMDCDVSEFHSGSWTPGEAFDGEYTHWMPLPAPPEKGNT